MASNVQLQTCSNKNGNLLQRLNIYSTLHIILWMLLSCCRADECAVGKLALLLHICADYSQKIVEDR